MRVLMMAAALGLAAPATALAEDQIARLTAAAHQHLDIDALQWGDDPTLPEGAKVALVAGDPAQAGVFIVYVKLPPNYEIPPHTHPYAEVVTVLKGSVGNGFGESFDKEKGEMLGAGATMVLPAGHAHYLWNEEEVVALLVATGPWNIAYLNPEDDPRNK